MKKIKHIKAKLNDVYDVKFTLEYESDFKSAILTIPFVEWEDMSTPNVNFSVYLIRDEILDIIDNIFFENKVTTIKVKNYKYEIEMNEFLHKIMPEKVYKKILNRNMDDIIIDKIKKESKYGKMRKIDIIYYEAMESLKINKTYSLNDKYLFKKLYPKFPNEYYLFLTTYSAKTHSEIILLSLDKKVSVFSPNELNKEILSFYESLTGINQK